MRFQTTISICALTSGLLLTGCGSGSGDDPLPGMGEGPSPGMGEGPPPIGGGGNGDNTFFNDDAGVSYASDIGGDMSTLVTRAVGSTTAGFTSAQANMGNGGNTSTENCDSGSISSSFAVDAMGNLNDGSIVFNNCVVAGETSSGTITFTSSSSGATESININFADFGTSGPSGTSSINGGVSLVVSDDGNFSLSGANITFVADGETTVFSDFAFNVGVDLTTGATSLSAQATIASSTDGTIQFAIDPAFVVSGDSYPTTGVLNLTHSDGSALTIDANSGNPATYNYSITSDGATTTGVGNWDDENFELPVAALTGNFR